MLNHLDIDKSLFRLLMVRSPPVLSVIAVPNGTRLVNPEQKIARPRQVYLGRDEREFVPMGGKKTEPPTATAA